MTRKPRARTDPLEGEIESARLDAGALGLVPLRLEAQGTWDPQEEYWGEEGEPIEAWTEPIIARGPRPAFEMEQVLPGEDPDDPYADPIIESNDLKDAGDVAGAHRILMELCQADLRCLDAHAHLGNLVFDHRPGDAIRHYEVGVRIGELSLGADFDGLLPWGHIDNRPFLRCMHGYRSVPVATRPVRRGRARLRPDALAQPVRQPGRALPAPTSVKRPGTVVDRGAPRVTASKKPDRSCRSGSTRASATTSPMPRCRWRASWG